MKRLNTTIAALYALGSVLAFVPAPAFAEVPSQFVKAVTATTYTFLQSDCSKLMTFNNAAAVAVTLPQAGTNGAFFNGCFIDVQNTGAGQVTITPTTSTINGATTYTLNQNESIRIASDSTNYQIMAQGTGGGTASFNNFRNLVDNGGMAIQQRGTGTVTCAQNAAITSAAYGPDRWGCQANVASGAAQASASVTTPPTGYTGTMKLWRNTGALTQQVCAIQEIPTQNSTTVAGQKVVLSLTAKALAGLSADNGNVITMNLITGTGADQGLGTVTASPAITPAWTNVAITQTTTQTITTSFARYQAVPVVIPAATTEIAVAICFTPTATGSGVTDGLEFTGVQLEQSDTFASPYEFRSVAYETDNALQYYWQIADVAATLRLSGFCVENVSGTSALCTWNLPKKMRVTPTVVIGTSNSFGMTKAADGTAEVCTTNVLTATSASPYAFSSLCSVSETAAVGTAHQLIGGATAGINTVSADF